jgi:hypothetical protein
MIFLDGLKKYTESVILSERNWHRQFGKISNDSPTYPCSVAMISNRTFFQKYEELGLSRAI